MNMLNAPRRREGKPVGLKPKQARKEKAEFSLVHWAKTNPKSERPTWLPSPLRRPRRRVLLQSSLSSTAPAPSTSPQPPPRLHQLRVLAPAARDLGGMRVRARWRSAVAGFRIFAAILLLLFSVLHVRYPTVSLCCMIRAHKFRVMVLGYHN